MFLLSYVRHTCVHTFIHTNDITYLYKYIRTYIHICIYLRACKHRWYHTYIYIHILFTTSKYWNCEEYLLCHTIWLGLLTTIICHKSFLVSKNICALEQPAASGSPVSEDAVYINGMPWHLNVFYQLFLDFSHVCICITLIHTYIHIYMWWYH